MVKAKKDKKSPGSYDSRYPDNPFFKNFGKKTLAVLIAVILWFIANIEFDVEKRMDVRVKYANLSPDLIITNNPPQEISLRLRGPRSLLSSLTPTNVGVNLDLSDAVTGITRIGIQENNINIPREVTVVTISPSEITLNLDELMTAKVKIRPNVTSPDQGFRLAEEPRVTPEEVTVKGPRSIVSGLEELETSPISLRGEKSKFSIQVPIQTPSALVNIMEHELVRVTVNLEEINLEKEFRNVEIRLRNFENLDYTLKDSMKADLVFDGPYSLINDLKSNDITVYIDSKELKSTESGSHRLPVMVEYPNPDIIRLTEQKPNSINLEIKQGT